MQKRLAMMASGFPVIKGRVGKFQESKHESKQNMWIEWMSNIGTNPLKIPVTVKGELALELCNSPICNRGWSLYISQACKHATDVQFCFLYDKKVPISQSLHCCKKLFCVKVRRCHYFKLWHCNVIDGAKEGCKFWVTSLLSVESCK